MMSNFLVGMVQHLTLKCEFYARVLAIAASYKDLYFKLIN